MNKTLLPMVLILVLYSEFTYSQDSSTKPAAVSDECKFWQSMVDKDIKPSNKKYKVNKNDEKKQIIGIECLLRLKGNTKITAYSAVKNFGLIEANLPYPTIEIAALFKISEIFYQKWNPADAIILMDKNRSENTKESIENAYNAYQGWLKNVKKIGLANARKKNLDPLTGSGVTWY